MGTVLCLGWEEAVGAEMECSTQGGKTQEARPQEKLLRWVETRDRDHQKGLGREGESMDKRQVKNQEFGLGFLEGLETLGGWVAGWKGPSVTSRQLGHFVL